jgi:hypothetical protein
MNKGEESGEPCSQCGGPTGGTWARWALCEECFEAELRALERVCEGEAVKGEEG